MGSLKHINISSDDVVVFEKVKSDQKLKTDAAVLKYLLNMYMEKMDEDIRNQKLVDMFMEAFSKNYYAFFERLRWATRTSEENSIFLLDAVNTILVNDNIKDGVPVEVYMHPVIATSKANHKRKVEHFKQAKDDRNFGKKMQENI